MNSQNPIILCVDDEAANLKLLENIFVPRGYAIVSAASGADALLKIKSQTIDIVLLDIMMPGMDGFEVCRQIKADPQLRNIPVIMITASTAKEDRLRGIEAGAEEFLSKPFDQTEALARINKLLKVKELYDDRERAHAELDQRVAERTHELKIANEKLEAGIVERERANEQLRLLTAHLLSAREDERTHIAREIHDQVGQMMTAVKMDLALLDRKLVGNDVKLSPENLRDEISATAKLVDDAIATMHKIVHQLRPAVLDHLGLRAAIELQMQEFQARSKIECQFDSDLDELNLDSARSTALFRTLQETLTNVARYAEATRVQASLRKENSQLILQVSDNGKGISEQQITNVKTFGLLGMRERAHIFGGDVVINGSPGQGTTVTVRIPV